MFQWLLRLLGLAEDTTPSSSSASPSAAEATPTSVEEVDEVARPANRLVAPHIDLSGSETVPAPWKQGHVVPGTDTEIVRRHLKKHLSELLEEAVEPGDQALVERLDRMVTADQLDLPPFPSVARELDDLLKQTTTDILQIARVVERDPGMVKRVWTQARSAMYSTPPRSLHHAVARVGLDALWRIGMSVCLNDTVFRVEGYQHEADRVRMQGIISAEVSAMLGGEKRGNLYMSGLLHDVGRLIVLRAAAEGHRRGTASPQFLETVSNRTRTWLSVLVAGSWGLDDVVTQSIAFHFDPEAGPRRSNKAAKTLRAASIAAQATALSRAGVSAADSDPVQEIKSLGFNAERALAMASETMDQLTSTDPDEDVASAG
jgi:HD-like signal output (HDOD) protein